MTKRRRSNHGSVAVVQQVPARDAAVAGPSGSVWGGRAGWGLLLLTLGYLTWFIQTPLRAYRYAAEFYVDADFLWALAGRPGGWVDYVGRFGDQVERQAFWGAVFLTSVVGLTAWILARLGSKGGVLRWVVAAMPGLVLVAMAGRYLVPVLALGTGGLVAMAALAAWKWAPRHRGWRVAGLWLMAAGVFHVAGLLPFLVFVFAGGAIESLCERRPMSGLGCWLAVAWWLVARRLYPAADLTASVSTWGHGLTLVLAWAFYPTLAVCAVACAWLAAARRREPQAPDAAPYGAVWAARCQESADGHPWTVWGVFTIVAALTLILTVDLQRRALLRIGWEAGLGRWDRVLRTAEGLASLSPSASVDVNRSLFHTGRLLDRFFEYPRSRGEDLLPSFDQGLEVCPAVSLTLLELGQVNMAEHFAHEAVEIQGEQPELLRLLARINVLKDRPEAARVYLKRLSRIPFERRWAERQLAGLEADPNWVEDELVSQARAVRVQDDRWQMAYPTQEVLEQAVGAGARNRTAFEYLIAQYLVTQQVEAVIRELPRFQALGFTALPRHVEEAVLLYHRLKGEASVDLRAWRLRPETVERFQRYERMAAAGDEARLALEFGDTYWFYLRFGRTHGKAS